MSLNYFAVRLGRGPKHFGLEGFNILDPIAHLVAKFDKYRTAFLGPLAFQRRLTDLPTFGQLSLGNASFGSHVHPLAGFVKTAMKALFAGKAK